MKFLQALLTVSEIILSIIIFHYRISIIYFSVLQLQCIVLTNRVRSVSVSLSEKLKGPPFEKKH